MTGRPDELLIDCSIVIPVYFNEGCLERTMTSIQAEVIDRNPGLRWEVVFVDDGSEDGSLGELLRLREKYRNIVQIIKLSRNFGQVNAIMAGYSQAKGKCVVAMSADGQDPASLINDMIKLHFEEKFEIVACARKDRDESLYRRLTSKFFYKIIKKLSFPSMPLGGFDFVLLSRRVMKIVLANCERHSFFQGEILWTGFKTRFIEYSRKKREIGTSKWTFGKKLTYLIDGVVSYSFFPIRFISASGVLLSLAGFIYAVIVLLAKLTWGHPVEGWTPLMIAVLVLSGFQLLMLGVIGEYIWRMLAQMKNRPNFIIESVYTP